MTKTFLSVFEISTSISLMVAALILLTSFLNKRYAAKWKYLIWIILALRLLIPFSGDHVQSAIDMLSQITNRDALESEAKHTDTPDDVTMPSGRVVVEIPPQMTTPIAVHSEKGNGSITVLDLVAFIWMTGSLIFMSVHLISYLHYKRQVMKRGTIIRDAYILHQMYELKRELNIKRTIHIVEFSEADSPMIIGFLKPVLVLPKQQYSAEELFFILKHELVHLKRGDVYLKLLFVTANAVHWFNPLIWIMQKEAAVDMELSCDERVMQGTNYTVRKAYTETLLSTLHKRCTKTTALSTQFYGGKEIMKRRFKNILLQREKKNGIFLLICAVILTISFGTLVGCSMIEDVKDVEDASDQSGNENVQSEQALPIDSGSADNNIIVNTAAPASSEKEVENKMMITVMREGEMDEIPIMLYVGEGYSICLTDDDWQQNAPDAWVNRLAQLWIAHYEDKTVDQVKKELADDGYIPEGSDMTKQESEAIYKVRLNESENDVWGVFYCYPIEAEEGWGAVLPSIADTFAVSTEVPETSPYEKNMPAS